MTIIHSSIFTPLTFTPITMHYHITQSVQQRENTANSVWYRNGTGRRCGSSVGKNLVMMLTSPASYE